MSDKLNIKITMEVEGKEGLGASVEYKNTDMKTVLIVQKAVLGAFGALVDAQAKSLGA